MKRRGYAGNGVVDTAGVGDLGEGVEQQSSEKQNCLPKPYRHQIGIVAASSLTF